MSVSGRVGLVITFKNVVLERNVKFLRIRATVGHVRAAREVAKAALQDLEV